MANSPKINSVNPSIPVLAKDIDLIGKYEGSGFKDPPYIARRADGQVIQLSHMLYLVASNVDGERDFARIAEKVSEELGRGVSADNVRFLVEKKLRPLGILAQADGSNPELKRPDPMLALKFQSQIISEGFVNALTSILQPLFLTPVVIAVLAALAALDVWLFFIHGIAQSARDIIYQPVLLLMVFGLVILSAGFHEFGHATACRYSGAKPGVIGVGLYLVWPAFYTDVTDAYRLGKAGRLRTDLGGIYFNVIFSLATAGVYFLTGFEPLLVVILIQHLEILHQLLPFLRLDGYYILSDLTGVPDMFSRMKPILQSFIPGRKVDDRVKELKPWVRVVVTAWVITVIPVLLYIFTIMAITAPQIFTTAWDSFFVQAGKVSQAFGNGDVLSILAGAVQIVALVLPLAGMVFTFTRTGKQLSVAAWRRTEGNPLLRAGSAITSVAAAGLVLFIWWPNGDYKPIQPGERGTIQGSVSALSTIHTGRPISPATEEEPNKVPVEGGQQQRQDPVNNGPAAQPSQTPSSTVPEAVPTTPGPSNAAPGGPNATPTSPATAPSSTTPSQQNTTPAGPTTIP